jgi:hypothetical protein
LQNTERRFDVDAAADALSLLLLFGSYHISWSFLVFPLWVFLLSAYFTGQHPLTLWASRQR